MALDERGVIVLGPGARRVVDAARQQVGQGRTPGTYHWLLALLASCSPMAENMAQGLDGAELAPYLQKKLQEGDTGVPLDVQSILQQVTERAQSRGEAWAGEEDICAVILTAAGYIVHEEPAGEAAATAAKEAGTAAKQSKSAPAASAVRRPTPTLEKLGRDLTRAAQEGKLCPMVGREDELQMIIETLCRRTKRNPVLVGPAGVGKTAIVEGLAQRIVRGEVPDLLRGARLWAIEPSALVASATYQADFNRTVQALIGEASQDGILLFIDEAHGLIGSGGTAGRDDLGSLLKPALARGDIACIAATTDDEYRRFIEPDSALERRFQPIRVQELTPRQTLGVMFSLRDELCRLRGVQVSDEVLQQLIDFAHRYLRNRHFPDKAVDLLEQCVAHALAAGRKEVEPQDAVNVVQRMIGMPLAVGERLDSLHTSLAAHGLLKPEDVTALIHRLTVSIRGLDMRPARPNATLLLMDSAAAHTTEVAAMIAENLFGSTDRIVIIDFGRLMHAHDVTMLLGSPPGYIGYSEALPIHQIAQMPCCVLCCLNLHACHLQIRDILKQALATGLLTDARGKRIYLSDTIVLLTADIGLQSERHIGLLDPQPHAARDARAAAEKALGADFVAQIDQVCADVPAIDETPPGSLHERLLSDLASRYAEQGIDLKWDSTLKSFLQDCQKMGGRQRDWERMVDEQLSPLLIEYLPDSIGLSKTVLIVKYMDGEIRIEADPTIYG